MRRLLATASLLIATTLLFGQEGAGTLKTGDAVGGSFRPFNFNGEAKGRFHCFVCEQKFAPSVLVFARDTKGDLGEGLAKFAADLDALIPKHRAVNFGAALVILSPAAQSSIDAPDLADADKLTQESKDRAELYARLSKRAEGFKNLLITTFPEAGPAGFKVDAKAQFSVVVYRRLRVVANVTGDAAMTAENAAAALAAVTKMLDEVK